MKLATAIRLPLVSGMIIVAISGMGCSKTNTLRDVDTSSDGALDNEDVTVSTSNSADSDTVQSQDSSLGDTDTETVAVPWDEHSSDTGISTDSPSDAGTDITSSDDSSAVDSDPPPPSTAADTTGDSAPDTGVDTTRDTATVSDTSHVPDSETNGIGDTGTDTDTTDTGTLSPCQCFDNTTCDSVTGECVCKKGYLGEDCQRCDTEMGYVEWSWSPFNVGCIPDPCAGVTCGGLGTCTLGDNGQASCACTNGLGGQHCNQQWHTLQMPPFITDMVLDDAGNGWFVTTHGLLYWDTNSTPTDTSDDRWESIATGNHIMPTIAIDSQNRIWTANGYALYRLDDEGTPLDASDDSWLGFHDVPSAMEGIHRMRIDSSNRIWIFSGGPGRVSVLPDVDQAPNGMAPWIGLFGSKGGVRDVAPDGDNVWVATLKGVYYVSLAGTLSDETDDTWTDISAGTMLAGETVGSLVLNTSRQTIWFNTSSGAVQLAYGTSPTNDTDNVWTRWSNELTDDGETQLQLGPVMDAGDDGSVWMSSPLGAAQRVTIGATGHTTLTDYHPVQAHMATSFLGTISGAKFSSAAENPTWLYTTDNIIIFDNGHTPTEPSDDRWSRHPLPYVRGWVADMTPASHTGVWLKISSEQTSQFAVCEDELVYLDVGDIENQYDDSWYTYTADYDSESCVGLVGRDGQGHMWVKYHSENSFHTDAALHSYSALNHSDTPQDETDDTWVHYTQEDGPMNTAAPMIPDADTPNGLWTAGEFFDYGASLTDKTDDVWQHLDAFAPAALANDAQGGRWFGYADVNTDVNTNVPAVLRYFDDGGTLNDITDDSWTNVTSASEAPLDTIYDVQLDDLGNVWVRGSKTNRNLQLCSMNTNGTVKDTTDDTWTLYSANDGMASDDVFDFAIDAANGVWVATRDGLNYLQIVR